VVVRSKADELIASHDAAPRDRADVVPAACAFSLVEPHMSREQAGTLPRSAALLTVNIDPMHFGLGGSKRAPYEPWPGPREPSVCVCKMFMD
jgi:hypothetical protein